MSRLLKENLRRTESWSRVLFMLVFLLVFAVVTWLLWAVVLFQAVHLLIFAKPNRELQRFGSSVGEYVRQVVRFLALDSDTMPFPFAEWPPASPRQSIEPPPA